MVTQPYGGTPTGIVNLFDGTSEIGSADPQRLGIATFVITTLPASGCRTGHRGLRG